MKKLLFIILVLLPISVYSNDGGSCGENAIWTYTESTQTLTISGHGAMNDYEWDTCPWNAYKNDIQSVVIEPGITSIGNNAFENFDQMLSISIPHSVVSIGDNAISRCWSLVSVVIPSSVTFIGKNTFYNCTKLEIIDVEEGNPVYDSRENCNAIIRTSDNELICGCKQSFIPDNVTSIGEYAFYASSLRKIEIPNSVTSIGDCAFFGCGFLESVSFGQNLQSIGLYAFSYTSLTSVFIPKSVTNISVNQFGGSEKLSEIVVEEGNPVYDSRDNCNAIIRTEDNYLLCGCNKTIIPNSVKTIGICSFYDFKQISSIIIPNSVEDIQPAFFNCEKLSSVTIGNGIKHIDYMAFKYCPVLSDFYCYAEQVPETDVDAFGYSNIENAVLHVPSASVDSYKNVFPWNEFMDVVSLPSITYMVDGELYKQDLVMIGEPITPIAEPEKEGYTFSGWSEIPETMPAHDVTVTGTFSINTYRLTYFVDGEEYKTYELEFGTAITPEAEPTKEGYTFSGWSEIPATMPAHDVIVTGSFSNKYKLTYVVDGQIYKVYDVEYGTTITPEPAPEKEGYTFSGWSEIPETMPAHDVTVTGTFSINSYKLTYIVDGEEYKTYELEFGAAITPEAEPTKEGYTFNGWSEIPETMPAHDVTVTGTFSINSYKLTYIVDGEEYKTYELEYGAIFAPEPEPTKEGYTFSGWNGVPATMPAHDVIVTGTFIVNKYLLLYILDGLEYKTLEVDYGTTITPEPDPVKEGYIFSGWIGLPETMPAHTVIVTGTFMKGIFTLTYLLNGDEYKSYQLEYGATITPEPAIEQEGHTFSGWSEIPATMPAHDVTVTGTLTVNKYILVYILDGMKYKSYELEYGTVITPEPAPEKDGYEFSGWSEIPETMPAHMVIVTGTMTPIDTSIYNVMAERGEVRIYTPGGKAISKLQKGLNIVVMQDGTIKKIVVK